MLESQSHGVSRGFMSRSYQGREREGGNRYKLVSACL